MQQEEIDEQRRLGDPWAAKLVVELVAMWVVLLVDLKAVNLAGAMVGMMVVM